MSHPTSGPPTGKYLAALSLAALCVVYGDIGTSPLYAIRESFSELYGVAPTPENILSVLSLIFWSLIIVISIKYLMFVMRADNNGEGGIMALTALVTPERRSAPGGQSERDPATLETLRRPGLPFEPMQTSYFLGRERILSTSRRGMSRWRERLFALISNNARSATSFFNIPPNRVVELGAQVEI